MPPTKKKIYYIVLACGIVFLMLFLAELYLKTQTAAWYQRKLQRNHALNKSLQIHRASPDPVLIYELNPGAAIVRDGVEYRINLQGFRDREFSDPSCGTAKRIVVIGDSVAWGWGVPMDQVWPQLLETKLNVVPGGDHTCIFNLAVNGYATPQEIRLLETRGLNYHPDIVILNYVLNDTEVEDGGLSAYFQASSRIELWYQARMLYSFVKMACINWLEDANIIQHGANEVSTSDVDHFFLTHETLFQPVETGFSRLSTLAKQNDFSVMVIVSPVFQFEKNGRYKWKPIHEKLRQLSLNNGFQFLDLQPGFINYDGKEVSFDPIHPNILGHKIIAEEVFTVLQKNKN